VVRAILATVIACVVIALSLVQVASDALYRHPSDAFGLRVYRALDKIAPAGFVSDTLANAALARGDLDTAERYAERMPDGERRDDLLAQIAAARGDDVLARKYYFAATDVAAMQREVALLARTDLPTAMQTEAQFRDRLLALGTHPDAVAESYYISANYEVWLRHYLAGLALDEQALALAPMNMGYILSAANNAYLGGDLADAQRYFTRAVAVSPGSGDGYAGLGLVALRRGDRARAQQYLRQARSVDPDGAMIPALAAALR
jgi:tetratricopeptide (TPR) repeat protein